MKIQVHRSEPTYDLAGLTVAEMRAIRFALKRLIVVEKARNAGVFPSASRSPQMPAEVPSLLEAVDEALNED